MYEGATLAGRRLKGQDALNSPYNCFLQRDPNCDDGDPRVASCRRGEGFMTSMAATPNPTDRPPAGKESQTAPRPGGSAQPLLRLRSVVLLAGSVRPTQFMRMIGRSIIGLPLDDNQTVLDHWAGHVEDLAGQVVGRPITVRVMLGRHLVTSSVDVSASMDLATKYRPRQKHEQVLFKYEVDPGEFRGTGGLLSDIARDYGDQEYIFVANAAQLLLEPLPQLVEHLAFVGGDVCIVSHVDGTPSGLMLIRCGCLRSIPSIGFMDLKEQALPQIAKDHVVKVAKRLRPTGLPMRTLEGYIESVREHHRRLAGETGEIDPFHEDWSPTFSLVENGSQVDDTATVHDSVVLAGGIAEPGAVLVRSVVCPDGRALRGSMSVDQAVAATERLALKGAA